MKNESRLLIVIVFTVMAIAWVATSIITDGLNKGKAVSQVNQDLIREFLKRQTINRDLIKENNELLKNNCFK